jgi:hypothetical protein
VEAVHSCTPKTWNRKEKHWEPLEDNPDRKDLVGWSKVIIELIALNFRTLGHCNSWALRNGNSWFQMANLTIPIRYYFMDSFELGEYKDLTSPGGKFAIEIKVSSCQSSNIEKIQERYVDQGWINTTTQPIGMGLPHAASFSFQNFILQTLAKNVLDPSTGDLEIRVFENDRTSY